MEHSREFSLLVACCRYSFAGEEDAGIEWGEDVDWALFLRLARFHRVQGLVWSALSKVREDIPAGVAQSLASDASTIAARNLSAALECKRILGSLSDAGLNVMFVKGLALAGRAYPNRSIKFSVDIDILIDETCLIDAAEVLQRDGYRLTEPAGGYEAERLRDWHGPGKESTWVRTDPYSVIDLHTRLSDHPRLIPMIGLNSPRQEVEVGPAIRLPTLRDEELFAYLCVHGASSAWFRLKWITDLAALLHSRSPSEIDDFYRRSQELRAGRAADQALLLADALYGTLAGNVGLAGRLRSDRSSLWLCNQALRQLAPRQEPHEPTSRPWGTIRIHLTQFALLPGWSFKLSEFTRQARAALR